MPTVHSSRAERRPGAVRRGEARRGEVRRAVGDVRHLLWFRVTTLRRPRAARLALVALTVVTAAAAVVPAWVTIEADLAGLLRAALAAVVLVSVAGAVAGAGGRELLGRDPAAVHPVSPVTDHLGSLLLAPLNAGWLIQTWGLLGLTAAVAGPSHLADTQAVALAWVLAATALAQALGWAVELLRRGPRGVVVVRLLVPVALAGLALGVVVPASGWVVDVLLAGSGGGSAVTVVVLLAVAAGCVAGGGRLAVLVARRVPRDEGRLETRTHAARPAPRSDLAALRRIDRASVWRSAPLRRGTWLLAVAPGAVALAGGLDWSALVLLPGLVASGCVLLFGVNLWCLDGRGMLWRESLPVAPATVVAARSWVLVELLLGAALTTILLGAIRAGAPTAHEALAVLLVLVVVVGQALSAALRWSAAHPHAVDLRSARATPAPPLPMVGYSLRLATTTTLTALVFVTLAAADRVDLPLLAAAAFLLVSALRVRRSVRRWADPVRRAAVVAVVAA